MTIVGEDVRSRGESQDVGNGIRLLVERIQDCNDPVICLRLEMWGGGLRVSRAPPPAVEALLLFRASDPTPDSTMLRSGYVGKL